ncbi:MAG: hypothetical protein E3K32_11375 [wastewater metagenome]|nr:hypothetical protein [Candidatus Loosdrechtia aerotolerans]
MEQKILIGTENGLYTLNENLEVRFAGHEVRSLTNHNSHWWGIINHREIWRSDAGDSWNHVVSVDNVRANCLLVTTEEKLFVGTSEAHLFTLRGKTLELVHSFEKARGRDHWFTPWGGAPDVRSISSDPSGILYVNVHVGGILRSPDEGRSWQPIIDIHADVHQVVFDPDSGLLLAASASGLAISDNGGESWQFITTGLHAHYLRAIAVTNRTVFVSASTGPSTDRAAIYRGALDENVSLERCWQGLPEWFSDNIDTFCLAASNSCIAFGTSGGFVFISSDKGQRWTVAARDLPPVRCVVIA